MSIPDIYTPQYVVLYNSMSLDLSSTKNVNTATQISRTDQTRYMIWVAYVARMGKKRQ
jgi:hypothetical protein